MYRCAGLAFVAAIAIAAPAAAQVQRVFPQNALRGALVVVAAPEIMLNGAPARLAPGARIRGMSNMLEMSGTLIGARLLVHYTFDTSGLVKDIWILTPEEAARRPWPTTLQQAADWSFDPILQVWSKP